MKYERPVIERRVPVMGPVIAGGNPGSRPGLSCSTPAWTRRDGTAQVPLRLEDGTR